MFKVNNKDTRTTPRSGLFIANFEHISYLVPVFLLLSLNMQMPTGELKVMYYWANHIIKTDVNSAMTDATYFMYLCFRYILFGIGFHLYNILSKIYQQTSTCLKTTIKILEKCGKNICWNAAINHVECKR